MKIVKANKSGANIIKSSADGKKTEFTIKAGQSIFEIDIFTGSCIMAKLEQCKSKSGGEAWKIIEKENHIYIPAFDKQHAVKLFSFVKSSAKKGQTIKKASKPNDKGTA